VNKEEARGVLAAHLRVWRDLSYGDLRSRIGSQTHFDVNGSLDARYQVDLEVFWDDKPGGNIRVVGSVDDGGIRAVAPLTSDFIKAPDDTFVDE